MKRDRFLSFFLAGLMLFSFLSVFPNDSFSPFTMIEASAAEDNNIVARADYLYNITWTAQKDVSGWGATFKKGNTYHIPYGQPVTRGKYIYWNAPIDTFINAANDATSVFYNDYSYYSGTVNSRSTYYAMDCSAFVSYCWDLSKRTTTAYWANLDVTNYGKCNTTNIQKLQKGDALNLASSHVVLVTDLEYDSSGNISKVEITEQTPPQIRRKTYTVSNLASDYASYTIYRYNKRSSVSAPPQTPSSGEKWYANLSPANLGDNFFANIENHYKSLWLSAINLNVQGAEPIRSDNQMWQFIRQSNGSYALISYSDDMAMDVSNYGTTNGTNIQVMPYVANSAQHYFIYHVDGAYVLRPECSDLVFEVDASSYDLTTWQYSASNERQLFNIRVISNNCDGNEPVNIGTEFYAFIDNKNVPVRISNIEQNVQGAIPIVAANQIWKFVRQNDGSYAILSYADNMSMDVSNYGTANGTNMQMMPYVGNTAQRFYIYHINNSYVFKPVCSDLVFDMDAESYNLALWPYDSNYLSKKFEITIFELSNELSLNANGGTCSTATKTITYMNSYGSLSTPTRTGYTFAGWFTAKEGGTQIKEDSIVSVTTDQTLYAHWTANKYTVTFKPTGGTCDTTGKSVTYNSTYGDLPTPTRTGHVFKGWFTAESGGTQITKDSKVTITANQTLYAQWTLNSYTVTLDANGGTVSNDSVTVTYSKGYGTLPKPTRDGYTFLGWFTAADGGTEVTASTTVTTNKDHTLYAHWQKNKVVGDVNADGTFNVADVVMLQKWLICTPNATLTDWQAADMCDDDIIDVFDLCLMKRELISKS